MEDRIVKTLDEREILSKAREIGERVYEETKDRMSNPPILSQKHGIKEDEMNRLRIVS